MFDVYDLLERAYPLIELSADPAAEEWINDYRQLCREVAFLDDVLDNLDA